jgi:hypothetical protein
MLDFIVFANPNPHFFPPSFAGRPRGQRSGRHTQPLDPHPAECALTAVSATFAAFSASRSPATALFSIHSSDREHPKSHLSLFPSADCKLVAHTFPVSPLPTSFYELGTGGVYTPESSPRIADFQPASRTVLQFHRPRASLSSTRGERW